MPPVRETDCGLPAALSLTFKAAVRGPVVVGLNVTSMMQFAPATNEELQ
jgi:hypothetical protein